jgi:predicted transcriptional regulator
MANSPDFQKNLVDQLTKEFLETVPYANQTSLGIYQALNILCEEAKIWELKLILLIAGNELVSIDTLTDELGMDISRSTIYRKIKDLIQHDLVEKGKDGNLHLSNRLKALNIIAIIHQKMEKVKDDNI